MKRKIGKLAVTILLLLSSKAFATQFNMPAANEALIGEVLDTSTESGDSAATVGQRYDSGFNALASANPYTDMNKKTLPSGLYVKIPSQHLLPNEPRQGIVINLPEMRMYYFPEGSNVVLTYPIGIGKIGKTIPITRAIITRKTKDPVWTPPEDIREFNLKQGIVLPKTMPPGPDNPLGPYAVYMSIPTYLIHSTIFPESVGKRASFGCIRMYESDIKDFFPMMNQGIPVAIINTPVKVGWQTDRLYLEAHKPLEEHGNAYDATLSGMVHLIVNASKDKPTLVDWQLVSYIARERDGLPHEVGMVVH